MSIESIIANMKQRETTNGWSEWSDLCVWAGIVDREDIIMSVVRCAVGSDAPETRLLRALAGAGVRGYQPGGNESFRFFAPGGRAGHPLTMYIGEAP